MTTGMWAGDPIWKSVRSKMEKLYARGLRTDDKGPSIAAYYAMRIKDLELPP